MASKLLLVHLQYAFSAEMHTLRSSESKPVAIARSIQVVNTMHALKRIDTRQAIGLCQYEQNRS